MEQLLGAKLKSYVSTLADEIGSHPAGHPQEAKTRDETVDRKEI